MPPAVTPPTSAPTSAPATNCFHAPGRDGAVPPGGGRGGLAGPLAPGPVTGHGGGPVGSGGGGSVPTGSVAGVSAAGVVGTSTGIGSTVTEAGPEAGSGVSVASL